MLLFVILNLVWADLIEHAQLFGNIDPLAYYYVDIWVGTPPIKQTVIVDTGSRLTAFPCMTCENCGHHLDSYFDYAQSSTSTLINCSEQETHCTSCEQGQCHYHVGYAEGSSIAGVMVEDFVRLGDDDSNPPVKFQFGCHSRETNLFFTQEADGICGLAYSKNRLPTLVDAIYEHKEINTDIFSLCFGLDGGFMTVGGYNATHHLGPVQYSQLYDHSYYAVDLNDMFIGGERLSLNKRDFTTRYETGTMIDSGTTFTYMASTVYSKLLDAFYKFCRGNGNCDGADTRVMREPNSCFQYDQNKYPNIGDFFATFPNITLKIEDGLIDWLPQYYLFNSQQMNPNAYCLGIYSNGGSGTVLGAVFMRGLDVIFDRSNDRIGFAPSTCEWENVSGNKRNITQTNADEPPIEDSGKSRKHSRYSIVNVLTLVCVTLLFSLVLTIVVVKCCSRKYSEVPQEELANQDSEASV